MKHFLNLQKQKFITFYEKLEKGKQRALLITIYIISMVIVGELVLFSSTDKYNKNLKENESLYLEKININKQKAEIIIANSTKTKESMQKTKEVLLKEVNELLLKNNQNYISSEKVPNLIEQVVNKVDTLTINSFKNIPNKIDLENTDVLVRHSFSIKLSGSFQSLYMFLSILEKINGINISNVNIKKEETGVTSGIFDFYVLNTNKEILNF